MPRYSYILESLTEQAQMEAHQAFTRLDNSDSQAFAHFGQFAQSDTILWPYLIRPQWYYDSECQR